MTPIDPTQLLNAAAAIFDSLWPAFLLVFVVGLGIGLVRRVEEVFKRATWEESEKAKRSLMAELETVEKPKRDRVVVGLSADGEMMFEDDDQ